MATKTRLAGLTAATPLQDAARLLLEARLLDVRQYEAALAESPFGIDPVHDMRVATRRLREAIHILGSKKLRALEPAVKRLQDALGAVRDAQILGHWLRERRVEAPKEPRLDLEKASKGLERALAQWKRTTVPRLSKAIAAEKRKGKFGAGKVGRRVRRRLDTFLERMEPVLLAPRPSPVHELRKAVKKLRYASELAAPAFPVLDDLAKAVEPLQGDLGQLHDADVLLNVLRKPAPKKLLVTERENRAAKAKVLLEHLTEFRKQKLLKRARSAL